MQVAILCSHQRSVSKNHDVAMTRMIDNIQSAADNYEKLRKDLARAKAGKPTADGKNVAVDVYATYLLWTNSSQVSCSLFSSLFWTCFADWCMVVMTAALDFRGAGHTSQLLARTWSALPGIW